MPLGTERGQSCPSRLCRSFSPQIADAESGWSCSLGLGCQQNLRGIARGRRFLRERLQLGSQDRANSHALQATTGTTCPDLADKDRKSVVQGKSGSVREK